MYRLIRFFRGYVLLRLTGAAPERCLNRLSERNLRFWGLCREDALHYRFYAYQKDVPMIRRTAMSCMADAQVVRRFGFRQRYGGLRRRPVLVFGLLLALVATFFLQQFVWTVDVQGEEELHEEEILRALEELGIRPGAWGPDIDSQLTKHRMLNLLPKLSWLAANRSGGCLHILVTERSTPKPERPQYRVANVVAAREGVLTEVSVLEGMKLCAVGQTVSKGQLLVSGYEDYGLKVRAVCANAEIYARTWHTGTVVTPATEFVKRYTGRVWTQRTLTVGRKRINLSGNSGIPIGNCDKMINEKILSLPGGYTFPIRLETATYREYELTERETDSASAEKLLLEAWRRMTKESMTAGEIQQTNSSLLRANGMYALHVESACREMIARLVPVEELYKGENYE